MAGTYQLDDREISVLRLVAQGDMDVDIARQLFLSPGAIKRILAEIFRKTGAKNRTHVVALCAAYLDEVNAVDAILEAILRLPLDQFVWLMGCLLGPASLYKEVSLAREKVRDALTALQTSRQKRTDG